VLYEKKFELLADFLGEFFKMIIEKCQKIGLTLGAICEKWAKLWKFLPPHTK